MVRQRIRLRRRSADLSSKALAEEEVSVEVERRGGQARSPGLRSPLTRQILGPQRDLLADGRI